MKRLLVIFSFIMFLILALSNYYSYQAESYQKLVDPSGDYTYNFEIPEDTLNADPKRLTLLKKAAKKNKVNIIRTVSYYDDKKEKTYTEAYLFLSTNTHLFEKMNVVKGRGLTIEDMMNLDRFISTDETASKDQVGVISNFGGKNTYSIHVLDNVIANYKYSGLYRVETTSKEQYDEFINDYVSYVNDATGENFSPEMYTNITRSTKMELNNVIDTEIIGIFFVTIMIFTFLFYLIARTKEISVMKLNGYTIKSICSRIFVQFFTKVFLVSSLIIIPWMFFIEDNSYGFVNKVYITNFIIYVILIVVLTSLCFLYAKNIRIASSIKGKKPIGIVAILNGIFKVVVSIIILIIAVNLLQNLTQINQKQNSLNNWSEFHNYGVFYPVKTGNDSSVIREGKYPLDIPTYKLYSYLNQKFQAIYIDSDIYTEDSLEINAGNNIIRYITVNPNYLDKYPIFDTEGNKIDINEENEHAVFLVPEQYKKKEDFNLDYFTSVREDRYKLHRDFYNQTDKAKSKKIDFIYMKSGQKIFSMNPDVMPNNNNNIVDPIIQVMTEGNALVPDIHYTSSSNQTLFIKLINNDSELTYKQLLPKLQEYKLDDNFPYLVQSNEVILSEINDLNSEAKTIGYILLFMFLILIMLLFQNIYLQFERNKFEFFLKKTFGHTFVGKYKKVLLLLLLTNLLEFIGGMFLIDSSFFIIFIVKVLIELGLVILLIIYFERKNTVQVLKEGV
ncbi:DUF1430 domain-containing protein [Halalkalibacterium halodurans]|uniref:Bacteriocin-associated integral membrane protein n=2 Tax=Halalkalibacterium halodurans TaxID=86665 RepID=A0A0M0KF66_ALKHA|nr:DUF1430 domain-containing protein [Halalkalibacterium halodurans]TPE69211.1 DUF1430 domain-containing protein [Halalkalibacterium halodurans]